MAEVLGAVASGLAVAEVGLKVGGTVWKLKRLWQEVHEVPETISYLMKEIEIIEPVLAEFEGNFNAQITASPTQSPAYNSAPAALSSAYCREALNDLRSLVEDLDGAVTSEKKRKRRMARIRVVLKKDTISGFQGRLERATRLLQSAQVNYLTATVTDMRAMMMAQPTIKVQQLSNNDQSTSTESPPFPVVTQHEGMLARHTPVKGDKAQGQINSVFLPWSGPSLFGAFVVRKSNTDLDGDATYAARIQLPKWLSQRVWDVSVNRACSGWQGSLCTWNIVPHDSPGMLCAANGDLEGLLDLFSRGLASHHDCNIFGRTIFYVACENLQTHIVQRLIELNLDRMRDCRGVVRAWGMILKVRMSLGVMQPLASRGFFDSLSDAAQDFEIFDLVRTGMSSYFSLECLVLAATRQDIFELYLRTCFPFWHTLRPRRKQDTLESISTANDWTVDAIRLLVCPRGSVQAIDTRAWIDDQASLLHLVLFLYFDSCRGHTTRDWHALLQEVITATDDLHHMQKQLDRFSGIRMAAEGSALKSAMVPKVNRILSDGHGSADDTETQHKLKQLTANLQSLMSIIASCGHDLLEFGRREAAIWVGQDNTCRIAKEALIFEPNDDTSEKTRGLFWCSRVIHYGPESSDWYFEQEIPQEDFAGEFWTLVERLPSIPPIPPISPTPMPGAWVDED